MALAEFGVWVRLHYVYPYPAIDDLMPLMAEGKILPYLDVPFQHASPRILKAMKRPASSENMLARIRAWRAVCPELAIRSTFILRDSPARQKRNLRNFWPFWRKPGSTASAVLPIRRLPGRQPMLCRARCRMPSVRNVAAEIGRAHV